MPSEFHIPDSITIHLGAPEQNTRNITLDFSEYIRIAASCELNPLWPENALRACILALVTFALNRVSSRHYRKSHAFDITAGKSQDLCFTESPGIFEPIGQLCDGLFNSYIARTGSSLPMEAPISRTSTAGFGELCLQETVPLAIQGQTPYQILSHFYGNDIRIVDNVPVVNLSPPFPGASQTRGMAGNAVRSMQVLLNRISSVYPAIPKISPVSGAFDAETENAVRNFQEIFHLPVTGEMDRATWYKLLFRHKHLRDSEDSAPALSISLREGSSNPQVRLLQQYLTRLGRIYPSIPPVSDTGYYGSLTKLSVTAFQRQFGLPLSGSVNDATWKSIVQAYSDIRQGSFRKAGQFPGYILKGDVP